MKNLKSTLFLAAIFACSIQVNGQTANEIIQKYIEAIGGAELLGQVKSVITQSTMDVMGNLVPTKTTVLNGKGYRNEIEVMGSKIVQCVTDSGGWSVNPMGGSSMPAPMTEDQFKMSKDEIWVGGALSKYSESGATAELVGQEMVAGVNAWKIKLAYGGSAETFYYFDPTTNYVIMMVTKGDMMGQSVDILITLADYKKTDAGVLMPYAMAMDMGGQFSMSTKVDSIVFNQEVDPAIFDMANY